MNDTTQLVFDRLDVLERRCSRLRLWCAALSAIALTACLSSALRPTAAVVEATSFVVRGPDGKVRGRLGGDDSATSRGLVLYAEDGEPSAILTVFDGTGGNDKGAVLHLEAGSERARVFTAVAGEHQAGYYVTNEHLTIQSWVKDGQSSIEFTRDDRAGSGTATFEELHEAQGYPLMRLGVTGDQSSIEGLTRRGDVTFKQPQPR